MDGTPGGALPHQRRLPLVRDPDSRDLAGGDAGACERLSRRLDLGLPDLLRVLLHPPRPRIRDRQRARRDRADAAVGIDQARARAGRALVEGEDHLGIEAPFFHQDAQKNLRQLVRLLA